MTKLPLFSTINGVIFPNSTNYFTIRRPFSLASVKAAFASPNRQLIIATQKSLELEKPTTDTIYETACLCKVNNLIELPDGSVKFSAFGESRFKVIELIDTGDTRFAIGEIFPQLKKSHEISLATKEKIVAKLNSINLDLEENEYSILANLKNAEDDFNFIMGLGHFTAKKQIKMRDLTIEEMNKGLFILDVLTDFEKKSVDQGMANMQQILQSNDLKKSLQVMEEYLETN
jgi:ATP-dependent Lon protease